MVKQMVQHARLLSIPATKLLGDGFLTAARLSEKCFDERLDPFRSCAANLESRRVLSISTPARTLARTKPKHTLEAVPSTLLLRDGYQRAEYAPSKADCRRIRGHYGKQII